MGLLHEMNRFYGSHILDTPILQLRLHHHGTDPADNAGGFKQQCSSCIIPFRFLLAVVTGFKQQVFIMFHSTKTSGDIP
jgi:hypothetical protein